MLSLNKYLINFIAQETKHPHRLRVCKKMYDAIILKFPPSINICGVRMFLPIQCFPNYPNFNIIQQKLYTEVPSLNLKKVLIIYTHLPPDHEYIKTILFIWNQKYACYYVHSSTCIEHLKEKREGLFICASDGNKCEIKFSLLVKMPPYNITVFNHLELIRFQYYPK